MKRIDLHIHTLSGKEENFEFNPGLLFKHVNEQRLDAIAITNHNLFDIENYEEVKALLGPLGCEVFPGVEADAIGTHILIVTDDAHANSLADCCTSTSFPIDTIEDLVNAFPVVEDSLIIPHYQKNPSISDEALGQLSTYCDAVETSSIKKAIRLSKNQDFDYGVVAFTDFRFGAHGKPMPKSIYIDTDTLAIANMKAAMRRKGGIKYNVAGTEQLEIAPGIVSSASLNLLIGRRSSGKTVTLDRIQGLCDKDDVFYIKQGELVADSTEENFSSYIGDRYSSYVSRYYKPWIPLLREAKDIGNADVRKASIGTYLASLKKYADSSTLADDYSGCHLFKALPIESPDCGEDERVIEALKTLLSANETKALIEKRIERRVLLKLLEDLVDYAKKRKLTDVAISHTNSITEAIKLRLTVRSSQDEYPAPILTHAFKDYAFVRSCTRLLERCWHKQDVFDDHGKLAGKYIIYATREPYTKVDELKKKSGVKDNLKGLTSKSAEQFFDTIVGVEKCDEHPMALFNVSLRVKDTKGADLSGGQRTEFIFMDKLNEAKKYPVVLIDEPESSFDNLFLDEHIAKAIRELANNAAVFVTSHNQVLSFALSPEKIFYTHYDADSKEYSIYGGEPIDESMVNQFGDEVRTIESVFEMLEASRESYGRRRSYYEGA